jgi:meso-butanediol dehydrogenase/(S,S)-butanediol dehydrogenase/diacetyl reductase
MSEKKKKLAIVTGAARGIGLATAKLFEKNGYKVALVDKDNDELIKSRIDNNNQKSFSYDISDINQLSNMFSDILNWYGRIDVLVNNAGVADFGTIEETSYERWNKVMNTNLNGAVLCSQQAIPY